MKLKNSFLMFLTAFVSMILCTNVNASSFTLEKGRIINGNEEIVAVQGGSQAVYFPVKYNTSNNYLVLCTGNRKADITVTTFNSTSFINDYDGAVVAAIIKAGVGENATKNADDSAIFFTQLAIWKSLTNTGDSFPSTEAALNSSQLQLYNNLIAVGNAAKTRYNNIKNFSIAFDYDKLNFTLNGDVYESQVIKLVGDEINSKNLSVNKGTVVEKNGGYVVRVNKSLLTAERNTITLTANATSNSIAVATNYSNGTSSEQTVTTSLFSYFSKPATKAITGEIVKEATIIKVSKLDATNNEELPGAHLVVKDASGNIVDEWTSDGTVHIVREDTGLVPGTYTLTETIAPDGYKKSTETITFIVKNDGKVISKTMKNYPKDDVYISKQDATTGEELPGAKLVLKDSKGKVVDEWISEDTPHKVRKKLSAGKYTLTETTAPDGYKKSTEKVTFTVEEDGTVKEPVIMKNSLKDDIYISKQDAVGGKELPGATLVLKNSEGEIVDEWVSEDTPHKVKIKLPAGKYILTETIAPDGYYLNTESIEFTVEEDGTVKEPVIMKNEKIVPTGDVLICFAWVVFVATVGYLLYYFHGLKKGN